MNVLIKRKTVDMVIRVETDSMQVLRKYIDVYDYLGRCIGTIINPNFIPTLVDGDNETEVKELNECLK